ncbi:hypothetical protein J0895_05220 [Phormidium pseudopriestleyi FRX01]|uniref:Cas10/Cmr2 second palm domain-containing protein n=1 Tax=Phormidium pseudopriestleyi FRX01 TaxID=1759528 RepID=A0ABS3FN30_9CYAN|nr:hypothetical protein [Phormidium pseudopriestleyi]MBO0348514.1 hypothetical protein [Phormidium pseudopriestleyi FRX01]
MSRYVATVIDTTGIQPYIFGSNRLRENIGGSYLVDQATNEWAKEELRDLGQQQNRSVHIPHWEKPEEKPHIEDGEIAAELVYAGGGNTVLLFDSLESAKQFTRILSSKILREAPGINLVAAHQEFEWAKSRLYEVIEDLMKNKLDRQKRGRIPSAPLLGLGVTASCRSTQLVAVDTSDNDHGCPMSYLVSREIVAKLDAVKAATQNLDRTLFDPKVPKKYKIPLDFDDFGRSFGENSYLAIVHADGNDMGKRFQEHGKKYPENRDYIIAMRELSHSVYCAGLATLKDVANAIVNSIDSEGKIKGKLAIKNDFLPFRPLVYGGDDVTFVCDGRLGLELASIYLNSFKNQPAADGKPLSACAGVCIVKAHYPFARAYELSEQLCKSAKNFLLDEKKNDLSAIDWHIAASGLFGTISDIRNREYKVEAGDLTIRPVLLEQLRGQWRTWPNFTSIIKAFNEDEEWKNRRNKIIALRKKLREGTQATQEFIKLYGLTNLPPIAEGGKQVQTRGWTKKQCGYFDAIEAMEFYISLKEEESGEHLPTKN